MIAFHYPCLSNCQNLCSVLAAAAADFDFSCRGSGIMRQCLRET